MPKVKVPRKSTVVDMTAMTDVAFLLLTFFMLATKFKPDEPVVVDTPSSISEIKLPEADIILITIDREDKVFFNVDGQFTRSEVLKNMGKLHNITFTEQEVHDFSTMTTFGVPIAQLKQLISMRPDERAKFKQTGIPSDSLNNELGDWVWQTRLANNKVRVAIKGDKMTNYPIVKRVIATLQEKKVNRFNFITTLERGEQ